MTHLTSAPRSLLGAIIIAAGLLWPLSAFACDVPEGVEGDIVYNSTHKVVQYCDGTNWIGMAGGAAGSGGGGTDTLSTLSCDANEIAKWNGSIWACAADEEGGAAAEAAGDGGQIQFNDGADALAADAALHWDNVNKRLGIGSGTPGALLHLGTATPVLRFRDTDVSGVVQLYQSGPMFAIDVDPTNVDASSAFSLIVDGTTHLRVTSTGDVGLGTTSPGTKLDVNGVVQAGGIRISDPGASGWVGQLQWRSQDGSTLNHLFFQDRNDNDSLNLRLTYSGSTATANFNILGGNVGIGTTTPQSRLHVAGGVQLGDDAATCPGVGNVKLGTLRFNGGNLQLCVAGGWSGIAAGSVTAAGSDGSIQFKSGSNLAADASNLHWDDTNNRLGIGTTSPIGPLQAMSSGQTSITNSAYNIIENYSFGALTTAASKLFTTLHIQGPNGSSLAMWGGGNPAAATAIKFNSGQRSTTDENVATYAKIVGFSNSTAADGGGYLTFGTRPDGDTTTVTPERMRINDVGNVGIGTTAPAQILHISSAQNANLMLESQGTGNVAAIAFSQNYGGGQRTPAFIGIKSNGASGENKLRFAASSNIGPSSANFDSMTRMTIDGATGNVGIGTTDPARRLTVSDEATIVRLEDKNTADAAGAVAYVEFTTSNGTRIGWVGDGSPSNSGVYLTADAGPVQARSGSNVCSYSSGASWSCSSDRRMKQDIEPVKSALDHVLRLQGVWYRWIDPQKGGGRHMGLIAQSVQDVYPELVEENEEGDLTLDYGALIAPVIEAVKELKAENDNLRAELSAANDNDAARDAAIEALRREIGALKASR